MVAGSRARRIWAVCGQVAALWLFVASGCGDNVGGWFGYDDPYEPNNSPAEAREIVVGGSPQSHMMCTPADQDWLSFYVSSTSDGYVIETSNLGTVVDTMLHLYDQDGSTQLAYNDDWAEPSYASRISFSFSSTGYYYVKVVEYPDNDPGPYDIEVYAVSP